MLHFLHAPITEFIDAEPLRFAPNIRAFTFARFSYDVDVS